MSIVYVEPDNSLACPYSCGNDVVRPFAKDLHKQSDEALLNTAQSLLSQIDGVISALGNADPDVERLRVTWGITSVQAIELLERFKVNKSMAQYEWRYYNIAAVILFLHFRLTTLKVNDLV